MNTLEAICTRRSIRKFLDKAIDDDILSKILKAAMYAPSAHNEQLWHFVILKNRQILESTAKILLHASMCTSAPCAILVCGDLLLEKSEGRWSHDCAAATQNMLLAIHELGLGGVWSAIYPRKEGVTEMQELLHIPDNVIPFSLVVLGYGNEKPKQPERFQKERIHYDKW